MIWMCSFPAVEAALGGPEPARTHASRVFCMTVFLLDLDTVGLFLSTILTRYRPAYASSPARGAWVGTKYFSSDILYSLSVFFSSAFDFASCSTVEQSLLVSGLTVRIFHPQATPFQPFSLQCQGASAQSQGAFLTEGQPWAFYCLSRLCALAILTSWGKVFVQALAIHGKTLVYILDAHRNIDPVLISGFFYELASAGGPGCSPEVYEYSLNQCMRLHLGDRRPTGDSIRDQSSVQTAQPRRQSSRAGSNASTQRALRRSVQRSQSNGATPQAGLSKLAEALCESIAGELRQREARALKGASAAAVRVFSFLLLKLEKEDAESVTRVYEAEDGGPDLLEALPAAVQVVTSLLFGVYSPKAEQETRALRLGVVMQALLQRHAPRLPCRAWELANAIFSVLFPVYPGTAGAGGPAYSRGSSSDQYVPCATDLQKPGSVLERFMAFFLSALPIRAGVYQEELDCRVAGGEFYTLDWFFDKLTSVLQFREREAAQAGEPAFLEANSAISSLGKPKVLLQLFSKEHFSMLASHLTSRFPLVISHTDMNLVMLRHGPILNTVNARYLRAVEQFEEKLYQLDLADEGSWKKESEDMLCSLSRYIPIPAEAPVVGAISFAPDADYTYRVVGNYYNYIFYVKESEEDISVQFPQSFFEASKDMLPRMLSPDLVMFHMKSSNITFDSRSDDAMAPDIKLQPIFTRTLFSVLWIHCISRSDKLYTSLGYYLSFLLNPSPESLWLLANSPSISAIDRAIRGMVVQLEHLQSYNDKPARGEVVGNMGLALLSMRCVAHLISLSSACYLHCRDSVTLCRIQALHSVLRAWSTIVLQLSKTLDCLPSFEKMKLLLPRQQPPAVMRKFFTRLQRLTPALHLIPFSLEPCDFLVLRSICIESADVSKSEKVLASGQVLLAIRAVHCSSFADRPALSPRVVEQVAAEPSVKSVPEEVLARDLLATLDKPLSAAEAEKMGEMDLLVRTIVFMQAAKKVSDTEPSRFLFKLGLDRATSDHFRKRYFLLARFCRLALAYLYDPVSTLWEKLDLFATLTSQALQLCPDVRPSGTFSFIRDFLLPLTHWNRLELAMNRFSVFLGVDLRSTFANCIRWNIFDDSVSTSQCTMFRLHKGPFPAWHASLFSKCEATPASYAPVLFKVMVDLLSDVYNLYFASLHLCITSSFDIKGIDYSLLPYFLEDAKSNCYTYALVRLLVSSTPVGARSTLSKVIDGIATRPVTDVSATCVLPFYFAPQWTHASLGELKSALLKLEEFKSMPIVPSTDHEADPVAYTTGGAVDARSTWQGIPVADFLPFVFLTKYTDSEQCRIFSAISTERTDHGSSPLLQQTIQSLIEFLRGEGQKGSQGQTQDLQEAGSN